MYPSKIRPEIIGVRFSAGIWLGRSGFLTTNQPIAGAVDAVVFVVNADAD